jgi:hypothetical protein
VKKGCFLTLAMYGLPMAAYFALLHFALGAPLGDHDWIAGSLAGLFTVLGISLIVMPGDARLLRRDSRVVPRDGERVAICGTLETIGEPLHAPFSGTACAAYNYNIYHTTSGSKGRTVTVPHITGMALAPSAVRFELGRTKILAYPMPEGFADAERSDATWLENARSYIARTQFEERAGDRFGDLNVGAMSAAFSLAREMLTYDDGAMRHDQRFINDADIAPLHLRETVIPVGEQVCLIGHYSAARSGVVPDRTAATRLIRGTRAQVHRTFFFQRIGHMILGTILVAVPNAAMVLLFTLPHG